MKSSRKICVVTGSRADYGLLYWPMRLLAKDRSFQMQVVATGMHLAPEFGMTVCEIERDGFPIEARVEMLVSSDTAVGVGKSIGLGVIGFAEVFDRLRPDWLMVLGDRFEILAAVTAACVARVPVAHLCGGDTTEGAIDEQIRHAITKMAHVHFVTNKLSARRVTRMGEESRHVFIVGSPGIDAIRRMRFLSRMALEEQLGIRFGERNFLITFHPATLEAGSAVGQLEELLRALSGFGEDTSLFFTKSNADTDGRAVGRRLEEFVRERKNAWLFSSLGQTNYLSLMREADLVLGNSSSGLYEAPSLGKPTVNIGDRQKGRLRGDSVLDCRPTRRAISLAIAHALSLETRKIRNVLGDGRASERIVAHLRRLGDPRRLLQKRFLMNENE